MISKLRFEEIVNVFVVRLVLVQIKIKPRFLCLKKFGLTEYH